MAHSVLLLLLLLLAIATAGAESADIGAQTCAASGASDSCTAERPKIAPLGSAEKRVKQKPQERDPHTLDEPDYLTDATGKELLRRLYEVMSHEAALCSLCCAARCRRQ
jgi:hypothetical protein